MCATPLRRRFAYKLFSNVLSLGLGLVTLGVVPRTLGPADFGRFEFVAASFKLALDTLTLQVPLGYFNWVSRNAGKRNVTYATSFVIGVSAVGIVVLSVFVLTTQHFGIAGVLWPDIPGWVLAFGIVFAGALFYYQLFSYLADGLGKTYALEKSRICQNVLRAASVVCLAGWGALTLRSFFVGQIAAVVASLIWLLTLVSGIGGASPDLLRPWRTGREERLAFRRFLYEFVSPLAVSMLFGLAFGYFDRWLLQFIGGPTQQGYFGLSDRLGSIAFVFTGAMTPLLMREFSIAHEKSDTARLRRLFKGIRVFVFLSTALSCFVSVHARPLGEFVGGGQFRGASVAIAVMAFMPIHQTVGQLCAAMLMGTGQTRLYAKLAIGVMLVSVPFSYFLLASKSSMLPGLELGATGLAVKMVVTQAVGTNIQLYCNARSLSVSFWPELAWQAIMIGLLYGGAQLSWVAAQALLWGATAVNGILPVAASALIYAVIASGLGVTFSKANGLPGVSDILLRTSKTRHT